MALRDPCSLHAASVCLNHASMSQEVSLEHWAQRSQRGNMTIPCPLLSLFPAGARESVEPRAC